MLFLLAALAVCVGTPFLAYQLWHSGYQTAGAIIGCFWFLVFMVYGMIGPHR